MRTPFVTIALTSPHMRGEHEKGAQATLKANRFGSFYKGKVDGEWGPESAKAANEARRLLGYDARSMRRGDNLYGRRLHEYLRGPKHGGKRLTPAMIVRRKLRLKQDAKTNTVKARALEVALRQVGTHESPWGSNRNPYGKWYGLDGLAWCAIFVTYCFVTAGDKRTFRRGDRSAWSLWPLNMARAGAYGLSVTSNPEPGDIVVYTHGDGHIGIFRRWVDRDHGRFQTVEGNTFGGGSDSNGGAVQVRDRSVGDYMQPHFVRFS